MSEQRGCGDRFTPGCPRSHHCPYSRVLVPISPDQPITRQSVLEQVDGEYHHCPELTEQRGAGTGKAFGGASIAFRIPKKRTQRETEPCLLLPGYSLEGLPGPVRRIWRRGGIAEAVRQQDT